MCERPNVGGSTQCVRGTPALPTCERHTGYCHFVRRSVWHSREPPPLVCEVQCVLQTREVYPRGAPALATVPERRTGSGHCLLRTVRGAAEKRISPCHCVRPVYEAHYSVCAAQCVRGATEKRIGCCHCVRPLAPASV